MLAPCSSHCCANYCDKVVIDIEGYNLKSTGFIIKELTICSESALDTVFFKPPCRFDVLPSADKSNINWLVKSLHGIPWEDGFYPYSDRFSIYQSVSIRYPRANFFAKGVEKCKLLEELLLVPVTNLDLLGCPKACQLSLPRYRFYNRCKKHTSKHIDFTPHIHCSEKKAILFFHWLKENHATTVERDSQTAKLLVGKFANLSLSQQSNTSSSSDTDQTAIKQSTSRTT